MKAGITKDTLLCVSLAAHPGNFGTRFHNFLYGRLGLDFVYKACAVSDIRGAVAGIRALGIRGSAVSMPFKESCIDLLDEVDEAARAIGAVNTIVNENGRLKGSNTDYRAVRDLLAGARIAPDSSFALFGSGGMAKALARALADLGFKKGVVVARNEGAGRSLAERHGFEWTAAPTRPARLLINASPVGMAGGPEEKLAPFDEETIARADLVLDVVAIPAETPLLAEARSQGKRVITGVEITALQSLEQFVLYTGVRPDPALAREAAAFARGEPTQDRP